MAGQRKPARGSAILSPHPDDAAFSVGALVRAGQLPQPSTILTVFSASNFAYGKLQADSRRVTALRAAEDALWASQNGTRLESCGFPETTLRQGASLDRIFAGPMEDEALPAEVFEDLRQRLDRLAPALVLAPLGLGRHRDHLAVARAAPDLARCASADLMYYEDLPYAGALSETEIAAAATAAMGDASAYTARMADGRLGEKIAGLQAFASQINDKVLTAIHDRARRLNDPAGAERLWVPAGSAGPIRAHLPHLENRPGSRALPPRRGG